MKKIEPILQPALSHETLPGDPLKVSDLDFYNLLRRQVDESRLFFNQRRAVIFDVEAIGTLRQKLIESLGIELAMGVLTRFGYSQGQGDAAMLAENFNWETDMDWLAAGPSLHMLEGVVHVQPEFIEFNRETGHFHMHGAWLNSYEAEEHLKRFGVSTQPVCWTLTGYASGYGTRFFGRDLLAIETECVGKGDARCYWEIRPVEAWGTEAESYRAALKQIDLSNQLVETNQRLQEKIAENTRLFQQTEVILAEQERLLAELQSQQTMLQAVLQSIPAGVFVAEAPSGKPLLANKFAEEILGKGISPQAQTQELAEIYAAYRYGSDEPYPANEMPLVRGIFGETSTINDMEIRRPDGSRLVLQVYGAPVRDASGEVVSSVAIFQDISEAKRTEASLQRANFMLENGSTVLFRWNVTAEGWPVEFVSQNVTQFGYTPAEFLSGQIIYASIIHPDDVERVERELEKYFSTELDHFQQEYRIITKDGQIRWVEDRSTIERDVERRVTHTYGIILDITDRKQAEDTRQSSQKFLQDILDGTSSPVYVLDTQGRFMLINQVFANLFNLDRDQVIGKTDFDIFANDTAEEFQSNDLEILRAGVSVEVEEEIELTDNIHTYLTHKYPLRDVNGVPYALVGISTNITERKKAEELLAKRAAELETITQVSIAAATILKTDKLLQEVVNLTKSSFELYHAHIYLLNKMENRLDLTAGAGKVGRQMVAKGWSISLEREDSLVAQAARTGQAVIANDVRQSSDFLPNPLLPETRAEMAVPLMVGDRVLGVLDVQANKINHFTEEDKRIQTILAGQIAVALENARLFEQTQSQARREQMLREVTARVRSSVDTDTIMRTAVQEIGRALGRPSFVYLDPSDTKNNSAS